MSTFKAINIESESEPDEEIDDTQEIQIEEALKLYQNALKCHSEGPTSFEAAAKAYEDLFKSDIFDRPEAASDLQHHEAYATDSEDELPEGSAVDLHNQSATTTEQAPNTLPQIVHLSYKNYGQFLLDKLEYKCKKDSDHESKGKELFSEVAASLRSFAEAISKDEADMDLWRKISILGEIIHSRRLTRLGLEAVLGGYTVRRAGLQLLPGPEEWYAEEKQRDLVQDLEDDLALGKIRSSTSYRLSKSLLTKFRPYSGIPRLKDSSVVANDTFPFADGTSSESLKLQKLSWVELGDAVVNSIVSHSELSKYAVSPRILVDVSDDNLSENFEAVALENVSQPSAFTSNSLELASNVTADAQTADTDYGLHDQKESTEPAVQSAPQMAIKRSTDSAGLPEAAEGGRSRSKRIRARESIAESANTADTATTDHARESAYLQQLYTEADSDLFETIEGILSKTTKTDLGSVQDVRSIFKAEGDESSEGNEREAHSANSPALADFYNVLQNFTEELAQKLTQRDMLKQVGEIAHHAQMQSPDSLTKSSKEVSSSSGDLFKGDFLRCICQEINLGSMVIEEASWTFLSYLLGHQSMLNKKGNAINAPNSSYLTDPWSKALKSNVMKILFHINDYIYYRILQSLTSLETLILSYQDRRTFYSFNPEDIALVELVQTLFELHLDLFTADLQIGSGLLVDTGILKKQYLDRWARLSQTALSVYSSCTKNTGFEELVIRFVWAFAFFLKESGGISDWQMISFLQDLKNIITAEQNRIISLPNSTFMPEVSLNAINEEISRLSLKGFFVNVFEDSEMEDPLSLIETLEPVLECSTQIEFPLGNKTMHQKGDEPDEENTKEHMGVTNAVTTTEGTNVREASDFVRKSKILLRLSLWHRLGEAYDTIEFAPKNISCRLRILELLGNELRSETYSELAEEQRFEFLLGSLGIIDQHIADILLVIKKQPEQAFSFVDEALLSVVLDATMTIIRLLYVFVIFNDRQRLGHSSETTSSQLSASLSAKVKIFLQDMQIKVWIFLYHLMKEVGSQYHEAYENFEKDKFEYLRAVHYALAVRGNCKYSKMSFLKFAKEELLSMSATEEVDKELAQLLYDLYGLRTFTNSNHCADHDTSTETLDRKVALSILDFMLRQIRKLNIKELHRTDLKASIDRVNMAIGRQKPNETLVRNRKLYTNYLKSTINPMDLYRCLDGSGALSTIPVPSNAAPIASRGWYFIMGNISLNKYRSQKRLTPGPTEELNAATAFFAQDIEYCANRWESWYRAAQVYDFQIEELVSWSAEKMNSNSSDLLNYQRSAIHCYTMAVACAVRSSDQSDDDKLSISDMYFDFGMRMYASSRPPFSMEAFTIKDMEHRYLSDSTLFKARPFNELRPYTAWKFAAALFKRAILLKSESWMSHYMLAKCLWKMHKSGTEDPVGKRAPSADLVVEALLNAIETLPTKKEKNREPIIEPHYKLLSILHKLVQRDGRKPNEACQTLQASTYASKVSPIENIEQWPKYVLQVLKTLRTADKSNWHHRMIARTAHVLFEESDESSGAIGAKNELSQHIFTKTMTIQVWKPEHERPELLSETADRANFELLARKVRKKAHDFYKHTIVWTDLCTKYLKVLREIGRIPELDEDNIFKMISYDEFLTRASKLEIWCHSSGEESLLLDILRETVDLKKLNAGLAKLPIMDDLIIETYTALFEQKTPLLEYAESLPSTSQGVVNTTLESNALSQIPQTKGHPSELHQQQALLVSGTGTPLVDHQPRGRPKGIGRREVQRRAEAAATKPVNAAIPLRPPTQQTSERSQVHVVIEKKTDGELTEPGVSGGLVGMESSAPASVHDSADDESELSDVEENTERPLFPGLVNRAKVDEDAQSESLLPLKE